MADTWSNIKAEREACAEMFSSLSPEQWSEPSWCRDWSVRDVAGHMVATAEMTTGSFYRELLKDRFRFDAMAKRLAGRAAAADPGALSARLLAKAAGPNHPPGPLTAMLGEAVVHGEDMRQPLGITRSIPESTLVAVADFYKRSNLLIGAKRRIADLRLEATDADWAHGTGPKVSGPMVSLVMAMTGREAALGALEGNGVAALRGRM